MNKAALKSVLGRNDWFASLPPTLAEGILELGRIRRLDNSLIYSANDADVISARIDSRSLSGYQSAFVRILCTHYGIIDRRLITWTPSSDFARQKNNV
jgi:hypothetical protein